MQTSDLAGDGWRLVLHRGEITAEDRERLAEGRSRREGPGKTGRTTVVRDLHSSWAEFLGRFPLDTFITLTYSDEYARERRVYSMTSALNDFEQWVAQIGFDGQYFVAAEPHYDRDVPHLHGLLQSNGVGREWLWANWFYRRGRAKIEEPRTDAARYYCSKYSLKEANPDTVRMNLRHLSRSERRGLDGR